MISYDATQKGLCYVTGEDSAELYSLPYIYEYNSTTCLAAGETLALQVDSACNLISAGSGHYFQWIEVEGAGEINDVGICGKISTKLNLFLDTLLTKLVCCLCHCCSAYCSAFVSTVTSPYGVAHNMGVFFDFFELFIRYHLIHYDLLSPLQLLLSFTVYFYSVYYEVSACDSDVISMYGKETEVCLYNRALEDTMSPSVYTMYKCSEG